MNKKSLELLKPNLELDQHILIEQLNLPVLYKSFLHSFQLGRDGFYIQFFKHDGDLIQLTGINFKKDLDGKEYENSITYFFSYSDIKQEISSYEESTEDFHKLGFIKIGYFDIADSILLGISEDKKDEVWKLNGDWGHPLPYVSKVASNIYEFTSNIYESVIVMNLRVRSVQLNDLVKSWDNSFWKSK